MHVCVCVCVCVCDKVQKIMNYKIQPLDDSPGTNPEKQAFMLRHVISYPSQSCAMNFDSFGINKYNAFQIKN